MTDRERRQQATADAVNGLINMAISRRRQPWRGATRQFPPSVPFEAFRQIVRRHRPSELLPALAALAAAGGVDDPTKTPWVRSAPPWAIALIARESILRGNELRDAPVTAEALRKLFNAFNSLTSTAAEDLRAARLQRGGPPDESATLAIVVTHAYEQFPYQESQFEEVSRSHAMLLDGLDLPELEVMSAEAWRRVLGAPLGDVFGATFFLHVAAHSNNGWFDHAWLDRPDLAEMFDHWPRAAIIERARNLSLTREEFKAAYKALPNPGIDRERYAPNPLTSHPFVPMPDGRLLAPQPALILRTITPGALFYPAKEQLGDGFARDMGHVVEAYVGRQLASIDPAPRLHPEVIYGKSERKSIDWFLDLGSLLIMMEVKSARFGLLERAGSPGFTKRSARLINRAVDQLERTSAELEAGNPAFSHIRADCPRIGVVVTAEPHYAANSPWMRDLLRQARFPTLVASLREIESLVTLPLSEIEVQLAEIANDPERSTWSLDATLRTSGTPRQNQILQDAWDRYPWPTFLDESTDDVE